MKLDRGSCWTRSPTSRVLGILVLTLALLAPVTEAQDPDVKTRHVTAQAGLSVGPFSRDGRGYKFSYVTLSVQALPGEAALVVKDQDGRRGLSVRQDGNVSVDGDLLVYGRKKFVQAHPDDPRLVISYVSLEGPEAGTYLRGSARLDAGVAVVELPEHFGLVTAGEGLTVTATPSGQWLELYVAEKSTRRIVVREASGRDGTFDYLVQGVRRGYERFHPVSQPGEVPETEPAG